MPAPRISPIMGILKIPSERESETVRVSKPDTRNPASLSAPRTARPMDSHVYTKSAMNDALVRLV